MIRVSKPPAPRGLARGKALTRAYCKAYEAHRLDYERGRRKFNFARNVYSDPTVRAVLVQAQNRKCCFCEGRFDEHAPGDVEHYRPKGAVRQDAASTALKPGYFWLAYSWENLYWCCQICNRSNKRDFFPLKDPAKRARSNTDDLTAEEPLLLDPGGMANPCGHIGFRREIAVGLTEIGRCTIEFIGLNRPQLEEKRRERIDQLANLSRTVEISKRIPDLEFAALAQQAARALQVAILPDAEFSAMAREFIERPGQLGDPRIG